MKGFILQSVYEKDRLENISNLMCELTGLQLVDAVYPSHQKVPFINKIVALSRMRTGNTLRPGEIGCLISHRRIWQQIIQSDVDEKEHWLILESDSVIKNNEILQGRFEDMAARFDLFFWGAWDGHMQLLQSTKHYLENGYKFGEPYIKSVYCTYGYSLNKKAARYLLHQTKKIHYPVDQFKRYIKPGILLIGGVMPELVTTLGTKSYIKKNFNSRWYIRLFVTLLDFKNSLICLLK